MTRIRKRNKTNRIIKLLIVVVILLFLIPTMTSMSKYVYNAIHNYYLEAKGFYFNSDKLTSDHIEYEIANNWSGAETYTVTVNLNSKKNDLLFAEPDIEYEIKYTHSDNIQCSISKTSGTIVGTNNGGINEDYFVITIDPANGVGLANGETTWVDIEVTSTSPYTATLSGKLIIGVGTEDVTYEIIDAENNPYIEVNITNSLNEGVDVNLLFDPNLILLDMTNNFYLNSIETTTQDINGYSYIKSVKSHIGTLETTSVKFYKVDPSQDYSYQLGDSKTPVVTLTH